MAICTDEFATLARAEATGWGLPGLPMAVVPHPLAKRDTDACARFAGEILAEVAEALTADPAALEAKYRGRRPDGGGRLRYHALFDSEFNAPGAPDRFRSAPATSTPPGPPGVLPLLPPGPESPNVTSNRIAAAIDHSALRSRIQAAIDVRVRVSRLRWHTRSTAPPPRSGGVQRRLHLFVEHEQVLRPLPFRRETGAAVEPIHGPVHRLMGTP